MSILSSNKLYKNIEEQYQPGLESFVDDIEYIVDICKQTIKETCLESADKLRKFDDDVYKEAIAEYSTAKVIINKLNGSPYKDPEDILFEMESVYSMNIITAINNERVQKYFRICVDYIIKIRTALAKKRGVIISEH